MILLRLWLLLGLLAIAWTAMIFDESVDHISDQDLDRILSTNPNTVPLNERYALIEMYQTMNGPHWNWNSDYEEYGIPWDVYNTSSDPCYNNWQAIFCTCHIEQDTLDMPLDSYNAKYFYFSADYPSFYEMFVGYSPVCHIERLRMGNFNMTGSLPASMGAFFYLTRLHMNHNHITGTLPSTLAGMYFLRTMALGRNQLTGTLPNSIGYDLPNLSIISLYDNYLTGTIPSSFGKMPYLFGLYLGRNLFTGPLPASLGDCPYLHYLDFSTCHLNGTLPKEWGNLQSLVFVTMFQNELTGTVPDEIILGCKSLQNFYIDYNFLTGNHKLDLVIHNSSLLQYGYTCNMFTGSLPTVRIDNSPLQWIAATYNRLHGTIPPSISRLSNMAMVELTGNHITGSIPNSVSTMKNLLYFYASETQLSGTIPTHLGNCSKLIIFNCSLTMLTGPLPPSLVDLKNIETIELYSNHLTGTVPQGILTSSPVLSILLLQNNHLEGPMIGEELTVQAGDDDAAVALKSSIEYLDVSNNQLGGTVVPELFSNSYRLVSLALAKNCIYATIPESICGVETLQVLAMDGMNTVCSSRTVKQARQFIGTVPECLFNMPQLATLHLSGNRLTGSLPDVESISPILSDLSLSHNDIHGSIPLAIQKRTWKNLDLSYNKLTDGLFSHFAVSLDNSTKHSISLMVNRLSGPIPSTFSEIKNIDVLQGSLFECAYDQNDLPSHDPVSGRYSCGTNSLNILLYIWIFLLFVGLFVTYYWYHEEASAYPIQWKYLTSMSFIFKRLSQYILLILLPVYLACSYHYKNYSHSYAWKVSGVYLSGMISGVLLLILWFGFLAVFYACCETRLFVMEFRRNLLLKYMARVDPHKAPIVKKPWTWNSVLYTLLLYSFILANMIIVVAVNAAYVYVNINYSNTIGNLAEAGLAVFKLVWNSYLLPLLLKHILVKPAHKLRTRSISGSTSLNQFSRMFSEARSMRFTFSRSGSSDSAQKATEVERELTNYQKIAEQDRSVFNSIVVETLLNLFNNIIAPCIATMGVDVNCFYNVFVPPNTVNAQYQFTSCGVRDNFYNCLVTETFTFETSYTPPFSYSYQCSSTLVTSYVSVFVFMYIFDTFFAPVLSNCIKKILKWRKLKRLARDQQQDIEAGNAAAPAGQSNNEYKPLDFLKNRFIIKSISNMAILLTFGLMFPPLAFIICYNVWHEYNKLHEEITNFYEQELRKNKTKEHRMISARRHSTLKANLVRFMEEKFMHVSNITSYLLWLLFPLASCFYAFFVFDMVGDQYGWRAGLPAALVMGCVPILCLWLKEVHREYHLEFEQKMKAEESSKKASLRAELMLSSKKTSQDSKSSLQGDETEEKDSLERATSIDGSVSSSSDTPSRRLDHTCSDIELIDLYRENDEIEEEDDFMQGQSPRNKKRKSSTKRRETMEEGLDDCCQNLITAFFR